jgi:hypothetical protein
VTNGATMGLPRRFAVPAAARELGVSKATVWREIRNGSLKCYRLGPSGRIVRVGEHHIAEYHACRETKAPSGSATTSSASAEDRGTSAPAGTNQRHVVDRSSAVASALLTFKPQRSSSPGSSPGTATSATPSPAA